MQPSNLLELLESRASRYGIAPKYADLGGGLEVVRTLSFEGLARSARGAGSQLAEYSAAGDRIVIACVNGLDFLEAFFGCLYAGAIPVPVCPPRPRRPLGRFSAIVRDAGARSVIATRAVWRGVANAVRVDAALAQLRWFLIDALPKEGAAAPRAASDIAFLQYTSGSTAEPRGVVIGHDNVMANFAYIQAGFGHSSETRAVTWLPPYHDMGLIAGLLQPLYIGHACYCLEPMQFLQQPMRWLRAISQFGADHSGAPPFAYRLCSEKAESEEIAALDLSGWRTAYVGAEPIQKEVLDRFAERFAPAGFRAAALYPAYGLAEATLKVTGGNAGEGPQYWQSPEGRILTGCGRASCGTEVRIVDPATGAECGEGAVGEVLVSGPGVARGFWARESTDLAELGRGYLRTGDLGMIRQGVLYITGRIKEVFMIDGRSIHARDIERAAAECSPGGGSYGSAAFSVELSGRERIVLVQETPLAPEFDGNALARRIRAAIAAQSEIDVFQIVFVRRGTIPRTTSGKVRRFECRSLYLSRRLPEIAVSRRAGSEHEPTGVY